ncbi:MAG: D-aminoacyl-tRNA deacylase [Bacteroidota bacterium]
MRALIQRVRRCSVSIDGRVHSSIAGGMLILLGVRSGDTDKEASSLAARCAALRMFNDDAGKMNLSVADIRGSAMVVSQFTLYADTRKGNRPGYTDAAPPDVAEPVYETFVRSLREHLGAEQVATGVFRAMMDVELVNDGPVTVLLESKS